MSQVFLSNVLNSFTYPAHHGVKKYHKCEKNTSFNFGKGWYFFVLERLDEVVKKLIKGGWL